MRDCRNLKLMLYSHTDPVIEASSDIKFYPLQHYHYPEMMAQMTEAQLSPWNNKWSDVYDFTPSQTKQEHFSLEILPQLTFVAPYVELRKIFDRVNEDRKAMSLDSTNLLKDLNDEDKAMFNNAMSIKHVKPL
jgi:hypothetical protein